MTYAFTAGVRLNSRMGVVDLSDVRGGEMHDEPTQCLCRSLAICHDTISIVEKILVFRVFWAVHYKCSTVILSDITYMYTHSANV